MNTIHETTKVIEYAMRAVYDCLDLIEKSNPDKSECSKCLLRLALAESCLQCFAQYMKDALYLSEEEVKEIGDQIVQILSPIIGARLPKVVDLERN